MTKSRNVPGQAGGYYLQETRFLYHLLQARAGDIVSLEFLGDVATEHADGRVTTEEDKSAIKDNPVTDRSENLWKTLHNWILAVEDGDVDLDRTKFVLYVPHEHFSGTFIRMFHDVNSPDEASKALASVKIELWGEPPAYKLREKVADSISKYVEKVILHEAIAAKIVASFCLECGSEAGYGELSELIADSTVPPEHADAYRQHMLGWVKERIDRSIAGNTVPQISRDEFISESQSILRKYNQQFPDRA